MRSSRRDDPGETPLEESAEAQFHSFLTSLDNRFEGFFQAFDFRLARNRPSTANPSIDSLLFFDPTQEMRPESTEPYFDTSAEAINSKLQSFLEKLNSRFTEFIKLLDSRDKRRAKALDISFASAGPRLRFKSRGKGFKLAHEVLQKPEKAVLIHTSEETKQKVDVSAKETVRSFKRKNAPAGFVGALLINNQLYPDDSEPLPACPPNSVIRFVPRLEVVLVGGTGKRTPVAVFASQPVSDLRRQVQVERTEVFFYAGNRLEEEVSFDFQGVPNNAEIRTVGQVQVTVRAGGRNLTITCSPTDSLEKVKLESIVASNSDLQATYRLKQGATVLPDNGKVGSLSSFANIVLDTVPKTANPAARGGAAGVSPVIAISSVLQQILPTVKAIPTTTSAADLKAGGFHDKNILDPVRFYAMFLQYGRLREADQLTPADTVTLEVDVVSWGKLSVDIKAGATVLQLKQKIQQSIKITPKDQQISFSNTVLSDDTRSLLSYGVGDGEHIRLMCSGENSYFLIPAERFDSRGDYDYTNLTGPPNFGNRGGEVYTPPAGWRRYGLKVVGLFENDTWLGMANTPGEWIVSYHGTSIMNMRSIIDQGFDLGKGKNFRYGKGVYSAPLVVDAEDYTKVFTWEGRKFRVAFMNRVNPDPQKLDRAKAGHGYYFVSFSDRDIRPYGLLIKEE